MTKRPPRMPAADGADGEVPPLETGMRMDRETFHRAYCRHPEVKKAELIGGVVFVASPVSGLHFSPAGRLNGWLDHYADEVPGLDIAVNGTLVLGDDSMAQPDGMLFVEPHLGGRARYTPELYLTGIPELVTEIAATTEALDGGARMESYRSQGIPEYILWRVLERRIDWYVLRDGRYEATLPDENGIVRSGVFPGLWLHPEAMVRRDRRTVRRIAREGIVSPEAVAFIARMESLASRE